MVEPEASSSDSRSYTDSILGEKGQYGMPKYWKKKNKTQQVEWDTMDYANLIIIRADLDITTTTTIVITNVE